MFCKIRCSDELKTCKIIHSSLFFLIFVRPEKTTGLGCGKGGRENREKTKYLDDTIRSTVITQTEVTPSSKSIFQEELQREITEKAISHEQAPLPNTPEQEMSNFNIGG